MESSRKLSKVPAVFQRRRLCVDGQTHSIRHQGLERGPDGVGVRNSLTLTICFICSCTSWLTETACTKDLSLVWSHTSQIKELNALNITTQLISVRYTYNSQWYPAKRNFSPVLFRATGSQRCSSVQTRTSERPPLVGDQFSYYDHFAFHLVPRSLYRVDRMKLTTIMSRTSINDHLSVTTRVTSKSIHLLLMKPPHNDRKCCAEVAVL